MAKVFDIALILPQISVPDVPMGYRMAVSPLLIDMEFQAHNLKSDSWHDL